MDRAQPDQAQIAVTAVQAVTPHNAALYEAGKQLLVDSIETGREFSRFMITTNMAAIPVYVGLLKLLLPETYRPTLAVGTVLLLPALAFMAGAGVSVAGYLPRVATFSLDLPEEIDAERKATILRRRRYSVLSAVLFGLAVLLACAMAVWALTLAR